MLNHLKKVRVRSFHGNDPEMRLIQYIMTNSPALEEMTVEYMGKSKLDEDEVKGVLQLICCKTLTQLSFNVMNQNHASIKTKDADSDTAVLRMMHHLDLGNSTDGSCSEDDD
ncbi:hypothetical protein M5689_024475 [Euphorbia peplus]|nr:hypothetical protein M5689_024475 [Euphorbia peplus]